MRTGTVRPQGLILINRHKIVRLLDEGGLVVRGTMEVKVTNRISPDYVWLAQRGYDLSPCYAPYYLELLHEYLDSPLVFLVLNLGRTPLGAIAVMIKDGPAGMVANSMPYYGSYGGCIVDPALSKQERREVKRRLLCALLDWGSDQGIKLVTVINHPFEEDQDLYEEIIKPVFVDERIGQVLRLPEGVNAKEAMDYVLRVHRKGRNVLRKGIRLTDVRTENDEDAFAFLYETHVDNMKAINGNAKERLFFDMVKDTLKPQEHYKLYVGYVEGNRAAACLTFRFGGVIDYFTPVIDPNYRSSQALSGIIVKAMQEGAIEGFRWWNWGGTWLSQAGVYRFKARWGGEDRPYKYYVRALSSIAGFIKLGRESLLSHYRHFYTLPFEKAGL